MIMSQDIRVLSVGNFGYSKSLEHILKFDSHIEYDVCRTKELTSKGKNADVIVAFSASLKAADKIIRVFNSNFVGLQTRVIFVVNHFVEGYLQFLERGAGGIVLQKNTTELVRAVQVVRNGGWYFSSDLIERIHHLIHGNLHPHKLPLTAMEMKVVQELLKDKTNQQIAEALYVSRRTVEYHIASAIQKLGVNSRVGLAVKIMQCYRPFFHGTFEENVEKLAIT